MFRVRFLLILCCALGILLPAPSRASMPPGHLYAAMEAYRRMPERLREVVRMNWNAYILGAQGHDLAYWAPSSFFIKFISGNRSPIDFVYRLYYKDSPGKFFHEDEKTGQLILGMLHRITETTRRYGGYPTRDDPRLAFALGWMTHYVTDLYIHTLVERYGGVYLPGAGETRHVQLELLESKHIMQNYRLPRMHFVPDREAFRFLSRVLADIYPDQKAYKPKDGRYALISPKGGIPEYAPELDMDSPDFVEMLENGCFIMNDAMECLQESARTGKNDCSGISRYGWLFLMDTDLVSSHAYGRLMNPIEIQTVPEPENIRVTALIHDFGLYGKFCRDWDRVMVQAVNRNVAVFNAVEAAFAELEASPPQVPADRPLPAGLKAVFKDYNILSPEKSSVSLPEDIVPYYDDTARGDLFPLKDVYYRVKLGGREVSGRAKLEPMDMKEARMLADNPFHSLPGYIPPGREPEQVAGETYAIPGFVTTGNRIEKSIPWPGKAEIEIPLEPDDPPHEEIEVTLSLTDEKPLDHPLVNGKPFFEGVEFRTEKGGRPLALRLPGAVLDAFAGEPYAFTAGLPASRRPRQPLFVWNFNDGSGEVRTETPQARHAYARSGQYYVTVHLYDKVSGARLGSGTTTAIVNEGAVPDGQRAVFRERQAVQEAAFIQTIGAFPGGDLEEKFQAYALENQKQAQAVGPFDEKAYIEKTLEDARREYVEAHGEEMPEAMAEQYEKALRQQVGIFTEAFKAPPENINSAIPKHP